VEIEQIDEEKNQSNRCAKFIICLSNILKLAKQRSWEILYTPPYSPKFNPIENILGIVKTQFRKINYATSAGSQLEELIHTAFQRVLGSFSINSIRYMQTILLHRLAAMPQTQPRIIQSVELSAR